MHPIIRVRRIFCWRRDLIVSPDTLTDAQERHWCTGLLSTATASYALRFDLVVFFLEKSCLALYSVV